MHGTRSALLGVVALMGLFTAGGCERDARPVPMEGVLTFEGKPLAKARVQFTPVACGRPAFGLTDDEGRFRLTTYEAGDGALPGSYKVTVTHYLETREGAPQAPRSEKAPEPAQASVPKRATAFDAQGRAITLEPAQANVPKRAPGEVDHGGMINRGRRELGRRLYNNDYATVDRTPLRQEVPPKGDVRFDLNKGGP